MNRGMDKYEMNQWIGIVLFIILCIILYAIYLKYDRNKRIEEFFENEMMSEHFENEDSEDEEEHFENEDEEEHFENEDEDEDEEEYYKGGKASTPAARANTPAARAKIAAEKAKKKAEDKKNKDEKKADDKKKKDEKKAADKKKKDEKKAADKNKKDAKKAAEKAKKDAKAKAAEEKKTQQVMAQNVEKAGSIMAGGSGELERCDIKVDEWGKSKKEIQKQKASLSKMMECQVRNLIKEQVRNNVMDVLSAQRPLLSGPSGPVGPPGPPGSKLQASGRLFNQLGSFESTDTAYERPNMVVSRASGTNPSSSYVFMDKITPFVSYQTWYYNDKNQIINRYDNNCMTYTKGSDKIYMDQCDDNNMRQKWFWDRTNRFVSLDTSDNKGENVRCMNVSTPMTDSLMSSVPDCTGDQCTNKGLKRFLVVGDCGKNTVTSSQLFSFG
jgi:hypothetical protein